MGGSGKFSLNMGGCSGKSRSKSGYKGGFSHKKAAIRVSRLEMFQARIHVGLGTEYPPGRTAQWGMTDPFDNMESGPTLLKINIIESLELSP